MSELNFMNQEFWCVASDLFAHGKHILWTGTMSTSRFVSRLCWVRDNYQHPMFDSFRPFASEFNKMTVHDRNIFVARAFRIAGDHVRLVKVHVGQIEKFTPRRKGGQS